MLAQALLLYSKHLSNTNFASVALIDAVYPRMIAQAIIGLACFDSTVAHLPLLLRRRQQ